MIPDLRVVDLNIRNNLKVGNLFNSFNSFFGSENTTHHESNVDKQIVMDSDRMKKRSCTGMQPTILFC